jgi:hypothetical protein
MTMFWTALQAIFVFAVFVGIHYGFSYVSREIGQSAKSIASGPAKIDSQAVEQNMSHAPHCVTPPVPRLRIRIFVKSPAPR